MIQFLFNIYTQKYVCIAVYYYYYTLISGPWEKIFCRQITDIWGSFYLSICRLNRKSTQRLNLFSLASRGKMVFVK